MRTSIAVAFAAAVTMLPGVAGAVDLGPLRGSQGFGVTPVTTWQGGYFGLTAGYGQMNTDATGVFAEPIARHLRGTVMENEMRVSNFIQPVVGDSKEAVYGAFAGYNFQFSEAVLGIELDFARGKQRVSGSDTLGRSQQLSNGFLGTAVASGTFDLELDNVFTVRARAGYTIGDFLPFITGGVALAQYERTRRTDLAYSETNHPTLPSRGPFFWNETAPSSGTAIGLAGGAGVDVALTENIFLRGEWQYAFFPDVGGAEVSLNTLRGAAGVKF
ncbi:outer membrane protein [Salinarimonas rosea]|uniref:outer membrane protein n=1 Tax=Salinarimonas rosea TaxID=552063 RepID=UPI0004033C7B|nr:outer membrane beta-barrel protein [Salinarimonas rosea]